MILFWLIAILFVGGLIAWFSEKINTVLVRIISLTALLIDFIMIIIYWFANYDAIKLSSNNDWITQINWNWIPEFGIRFHLAIDGLSLILIALTLFLGILSVLTSWSEIKERVGFFHFNILWILAGIMGVFLSLDLFLFYFFWEVMLIPMYFIIGIWGHENRIYAAFKFFIFTQASGLLMFIAILALYFIHGSQTGNYTFEYEALLGTSLSSAAAMWLMLGFLIAFAVKLPAIPFHNWLPDAHTEAPTAGSVILAGLLLKTGAYGILRFVIPLFPSAAKEFAPVAMLIGVAGILYGAKLAFAQTDLKRLVAYSSVSHMGFVLLGIFALNQLAFQGVVMQIIAHGISTGALFILVGSLQERIHTRDLNQMGGLWEQVPKMGAIGLLFTMASLGLPGLGNFIAEFLILSGSYQASIFITALAALGLVASTIYSLRILQKVFYGNKVKEWSLKDFNFRELVIMGSMIVIIVWLGIFPQTFLNTSKNSMKSLISSSNNVKFIDDINQNKTELNQEILSKDDFNIQNDGDISYISSIKRIKEGR
ncbi:MAG: NADH-quinone oxidoreductase subunit M [Ignavibacteriaceae bacterium]